MDTEHGPSIHQRESDLYPHSSSLKESNGAASPTLTSTGHAKKSSQCSGFSPLKTSQTEKKQRRRLTQIATKKDKAINIAKPKFRQSKRVITAGKPLSNLTENGTSPLPAIKESLKQDNAGSPLKVKAQLGLSLDNKTNSQPILKTEEVKKGDYVTAKEQNNQSMMQMMP